MEARPDNLFFIFGGLVMAHLAQHARRQAPQLPIGASEWAATEQPTALRKRKTGQSPKPAVHDSGPCQGLLQTIVFDDNGDTQRKVFFTQVCDGRWVKLN